MSPTLSIIGGGPAGLRAAEVASAAGISVDLFDAKPSVGRKFLVAGKGGLNLTHGEPLETFLTRYTGPSGFWRETITSFTPSHLREWAAELGVETFQATSGRVYPKALKAAPLLRRWIARLKDNGVRFHMNHRLARWERQSPDRRFDLHFSNNPIHPTDAILLALGGASWPQTGSDGKWTETLSLPFIPLQPANCGWETDWPEFILPIIEGQPLKNVTATSGDQTARGEIMLTRYGLEGGILYQLGATLRAMESPAISIDLKPTFTEEQLSAKLNNARRNLHATAKSAWKLSDAASALLDLSPCETPAQLAARAKSLVIPLTRPRPIDEAISSAGGVPFSSLDENLMLRDEPGIFLAGEMIDWEAPTGGYLLQGSFATATRAADAATTWLRNSSSY